MKHIFRKQSTSQVWENEYRESTQTEAAACGTQEREGIRAGWRCWLWRRKWVFRKRLFRRRMGKYGCEECRRENGQPQIGDGEGNGAGVQDGSVPQADWGKPQAEQLLPYNPCTSYFRRIIEQLLEHYGLGYRDMCLVLVDAEPEGELDIYTHDDDEAYLVGQLLKGLNECCIYTGRQEYFTSFAEEVLQESGLMTEIHGKQELQLRAKQSGAQDMIPWEEAGQRNAAACKRNLILDFEAKGSMEEVYFGKYDIYVPIYKKPWRISANLDISVPIGYNTVIVKGVETEAEETPSDWLEREFYAE